MAFIPFACATPLALLAQGAPAQGGGLSMIFLFVPMLLIMYFFMIRPQQRRQKEHEAMLKALQSGDRVVTTGGIVGTITKSDETSVKMRIATSVEVTVMRSYIAGKAPEETP